MTTAEKIKYLLKVMHWTQQQLADEIGVHQVTISAWLRGRAVRDSYVSAIENVYAQIMPTADYQENERTKPIPKIERPVGRVLSEGGKIILNFPWYSYQKK